MGGLFESRGYSERERFFLYFAVCIWVRLAAAYIASLLVKAQTGKIVVGGVALIAMWTNFSGIFDTTVWWSRQTHFFFATCVFMSILFGQQHLAGPIIVGDTVFGIAHTLLHHGVVRICPIF